ncbi:hypothetical protein [Microbacterium sp.]|uniref:hypothetical protein n=1 Tax=Microbacterium sp. TaxID=51671 RepID=UPI003C2813B1
MTAAECDGSEVVIRFTPLAADRLLENAEDTFVDESDRGRQPPRYGVSVIAGWCEEGEDFAQTVERILASSSLRGRTISVVTGTQLRAKGFEVVGDPNGKEPMHHLVGDDPFSEPPRVDVLASLLEDGRMRNPAYKRSTA